MSNKFLPSEIPVFPHFLNPDQYKTTPVPELENPIVTGTSVLGIKFNGGVMLAADTLGSYGSLARFRDLRRVRQVGDNTILGAGGEYSDFQFVLKELDKVLDRDFNHNDGYKHTPKEIYQYLVRVMYSRRSKFDPFWNSLVVAGFRDGKQFLGLTDLLGSHYEDNTIATGYGGYIAQPILRKFYDDKKGNISKEEAKAILEKCLTVLFYRDARTINKIQIAVADENGVQISEPYPLPTQWTFKGF